MGLSQASSCTAVKKQPTTSVARENVFITNVLEPQQLVKVPPEVEGYGNKLQNMAFLVVSTWTGKGNGYYRNFKLTFFSPAVSFFSA